MKKFSQLLFLLLCLVISSAFIVLFKNTGGEGVRTNNFNDTTAGKDILPEMLALNSNDKFKPTQNFRAGHVTPAKLNNYLHKTENGYYIQLPATGLVPTPAVVNGNLLLSGGFGSKEYYSFNPQTGQLKWAIHLDDDGPSSPAVEDGVVVFNTESCTIFGCDLITGKMIWSYYLGDPLMSMPTIANGLVFTSYPAAYSGQFNNNPNDTNLHPFNRFPSHVMIAIELKTGKIRWQKWIDSDIMSAPVAKDDLLYVTTFAGSLYTVKQKTGEIIAAKAMRATSVPVFGDNNALIVSKRSDNERDSVARESIVMSGTTTASATQTLTTKQAYYLDHRVQDKAKLKSEAKNLDAGNGFVGGAPTSANWQAASFNVGYSNVSSLQAFQGSRGLYKDGMLYNTMGDELVCTNKAGTEQWTYKLGGDLKTEGGFMGTPPIHAGGYIIVATFTGDVLTIDEKTGKLVTKYELKHPVRYQPIADKGWIYVTTTDGRLYAINTGNPSITGWNMWGANSARTNVN